MKFLVTIALALLLLTLESVVVQQLGLAISRIDVTVVLVAFLAVRANTLEGSISAFSVGYLLDLMSGQPTGLFTFLAVFTFLVGKLVVSLVGHGVLASFFTWLTTKEGSATALLPGLPLQVTLTGIAAAFLYPLLRRFEASQDRSSSAGLLR
jgi:rod shape-determining protein MreD